MMGRAIGESSLGGNLRRVAMPESSPNTASSTGAQAADRASRPTDERQPPCWACEQYGGYEHDWMDCPACVAGYERWQATDRTYTADEVRVLMAAAWDAGRYDETQGSAPVDERRAREV